MPVKLKVKEYHYVGQLLPKNIREYFVSNPGDYASSYDTVVLEVEEIEESPSGSVRDTMEHGVDPDPKELSTINVADLLGLVKGKYEKYIPKFSERDTDSVSNRSLLANAFEGIAKPEEREMVQKYKDKIDLINEEERKLRELNEQIKELSFAKGPRDKKISALRFDANQAANRINTYDKQLLRLEASQPLQDVLAREKKLAYKKAEQRGKEALAEYKAKAEKKQSELVERYRESREKVAERRQSSYVRSKIKAFKARLESSLLSPTDRCYVPIDLIKAMVEVCELIDTDTELYNTDGTVNKAQEKRNLTKEKLQNLKDEYEKLKTHSDPIYAGELDEMVYTYLTELRDNYAGNNLNEMSLDELTGMYEILRGIEETLQDARKLIGWGGCRECL